MGYNTKEDSPFSGQLEIDVNAQRWCEYTLFHIRIDDVLMDRRADQGVESPVDHI